MSTPIPDFTAIIPARYASTRLPGKPLADIHGKPMVAHVIAKAKLAGAKRIIVATDHQGVFDAVKKFDAEPCMTSVQHQSGTERLAEVIDKLRLPDDEIILNVQGDEPLAPSEIIQQLAKNLNSLPFEMATLATPICLSSEIFNTNVVKVVRDKHGAAIYFSRATIPWHRESFNPSNQQQPVLARTSAELEKLGLLRHLGIYAYRAGFIKRYVTFEPSPLEHIELLEQLRVLWHGEKIHVDIAEVIPEAGVDTPEDLIRVREFLAKSSWKDD
ncbi:3-deoxy-manno-octulosonate cytidylyltransferase [Thorsellia anophelis]|uniref:3-deoxy-manno-octulosonate cytidylyltransferase n=1 Tax=Thorsellia anophelis DSM 18579 TaxID=1123402 RepID=A0A1I0C097_9GAMM|nr:3-deoxy-manno-octulosonate cytidylyltransferase [Thorsellia anophelis]SET12707.1 3-deoxy-manno-octulosonate cytidylyltransferase (CMP-KDO synthetase) [Thorsellia anophelis DSM 18579]